MKTKRRHDLQTNQLADWLGRNLQAIKPYRQLLVGGALAIIVFVGAVTYISRMNQGAAESAWHAFTIVAAKTNATPQDFEVITGAPDADPVAAHWARLLAADNQLRAAAVDMYTDRPTAKQQLLAAKKDYDTVIANSADQPLMRSRAVFGLGQTCECLSAVGGDGKTSAEDYLKNAKKHYQQLVDQAGETWLGRSAAYRLKRLGDPDVAHFYGTFASYTPPTADSTDDTVPLLPDVPDLSFPGDDLPLPERPDISFPEIALLDAPIPGGGQFQPVAPPGDVTPVPADTAADGSDAPETATRDAANTSDAPSLP